MGSDSDPCQTGALDQHQHLFSRRRFLTHLLAFLASLARRRHAASCFVRVALTARISANKNSTVSSSSMATSLQVSSSNSRWLLRYIEIREGDILTIRLSL